MTDADRTRTRRDCRSTGSAASSTERRRGLLERAADRAGRRGRQVQPHLRGRRRHDARSSCAGRRSATCSPPPTTWCASTASSRRCATPPCRCPSTYAVCDGPRRHRRAVLRHGARRRARPTASTAQLEPLGAERTRARSRAAWSTPSSRCTPSTRPRSGWPTSAGPRASSSGRCAAGSSSSTPRAAATCPASTSCTQRLAGAVPAQGAPRSCTATSASTTSSSTSDDEVSRRARLGDGHARRPAHRRRRCSWSTSGSPLLMDCVAVSDVSRRARLPQRPPSCVERYAAAQRPRPRPTCRFHLGLAYFKLAVILEGIHYRYTQGQTVGERLRHASARPSAPLVDGTASPPSKES